MNLKQKWEQLIESETGVKVAAHLVGEDKLKVTPKELPLFAYTVALFFSNMGKEAKIIEDKDNLSLLVAL